MQINLCRLTMDSNSAQQLEKFISENNLKTQEGIVLFDAVITFYRTSNPLIIFSEVQVITLPKEKVLYVLEFIKDLYYESEIYSTSLYFFNYTGNNILEARDATYKDLLLFTVKPLDKKAIAARRAAKAK